MTLTELDEEQVWNAETGELLGEPPTPDWFWEVNGIHIEFSNAEIYPRLFLALAIFHEATHKFAGTEDHAYTDEDEYRTLNNGNHGWAL